MLRGESGRAPALRVLDRDYHIDPIDVLDRSALRSSILMLVQPRRLAPAELVALDDWVRGGGRALILADPRLDWPSRYPLGDPRRAPIVTLLDPLFTHWGLELTPTEAGTGRWRTGGNCTAVASDAVDCAIGQGRALLIGDVDLLRDDAGVERVREALDALSGRQASRETIVGLFGGLVALLLAFVVSIRERRRKKKRT